MSPSNFSSVVVAGASRGLGLEYVKYLSSQPEAITVIGLYRSTTTAGALLDLVKENKNVHAIRADIGKVSDVEAAAKEASKILNGKLDLLINNAFFLGPGFFTPFHERSLNEVEEDLQKAFQVNAIGPVITTMAFLSLLRAGKAKKVMNISTLAANAEMVMASGVVEPSYSTTKAALNMATASLGMTLKDEGFTILSVSPGVFAFDTGDDPRRPGIYELIQKVYDGLKKIFPDWNGTPDSPEKTAKMTLEVIDKATPDQTGVFASHFGVGDKRWL